MKSCELYEAWWEHSHAFREPIKMASRHVERNSIDDKEMEQRIEQRSSGKESTTSDTDYFGPARPMRGQQVKKHYRKWWWLHLLIMIAIVLIVTLPL